MSLPAATRRSLAPLAIVTAAAFLFALLLLLVRLHWALLESADHGAATRLNSLVAGHSVVVSIVKAVTWLGSGGVLWTLIGAAAVVLALRRRWRLAAYLLEVAATAVVLAVAVIVTRRTFAVIESRRRRARAAEPVA